MEEKVPKIVKSLVVSLPLRLLGCAYDEELHIVFYDNDEVHVTLPISGENLMCVPKDFDRAYQGLLVFEKDVHDEIDHAYVCMTMEYGVRVKKPIEELLKRV